MDEPFFRKAYEADPTNAARQSVGDYLGWVKSFYEGKRFPPVAGWTSREKELSARLKAEARGPVLARLADVGKRIAAEWAKDNATRRVTTDDLRRFGGDLDVAAKADGGDGARLLEACAKIEGELALKGL